jgi:glyoxylase-like metal-dependent hydrolase (beta-lactamase superfamily II)
VNPSARGRKEFDVINTHGHLDHTNGNAKAAELTAAPVAAFADSSLACPDLGLGDEQNPFLRRTDVAAFIALTRDWPAVKQRLGLK